MDDKTEIPLSWRLTKLGDLGEVNRGRSRHRPRYASHLYNGPYPFIQTGDIKNSDGRISEYQQTYSEAGLAQSRLWPKGTMCVTIAANIAETAILNFPACFPDSIVGFIADESKCETRFVEYTFRNLKARIQHEATGSVQDNINLATLDRLRFPLPPLLEQHAIAEILGILDDKIEHNRQMNRTLEAMARAVFNAWFVDFDPVQAKAAGRQSFPGMPQGVFEQLPDRFIETEFGSVPEGWTYVPIGELVDVIGGGTPSTKNPDFWRGGKFPFCTPKDMSRLASPALLETERHITQAGVDKISSGQLPVGTVILSSRAPIGYLALAEMPISVNQGIIAMITGEIPNTYVLL
jgi:type I restriction enzyme S subunit